MDILDIIKNRRSIRRFKSREIEEEKIEKLLEAVKWAPSAGNLQARDIILVRDKYTKEKIAEAALSQDFISEAPLVFVFCANKEKSRRRYGHRGEELYCIQDTTASIENLILEAYSLDLGTCWVGAFDEEELRKMLGIPQNVRPIAIIPVGYADEKPLAPRRNLDLHEDKW